MKRPDPEAILRPLKSFQKRTVSHAFDRLFLAKDSTARFLVADEVGLGKTLVARGIIAQTIEHLWDDVDRIDIVYICSNASIARANLPKLRVGGESERSFALATRLTLLAEQLADGGEGSHLADSKLNFVSFTPGTSFAMGNSGGRRDERRLLFHLMKPLVHDAKPLLNILQGNIGDSKRWRRFAGEDVAIEETIRDRFRAAVSERTDLLEDFETLQSRWFHRSRTQWPREARRARNHWTGQLRQILAEVCVHALEPDLIILDEFQRFRHLLEPEEEKPDPAAELARTLFGAVTPEGNPVRTLLLSATPYKLYTSDAELEEDDHYEDFLATTRFLLNEDEARVETLRRDLRQFGVALKRAAAGEPSFIPEAKAAVEDQLRAVMARTERVAATAEGDAMLGEERRSVFPQVADVRQYLAADAIFRAVGGRDPMPFWKSAPYLAHFMHGYKVSERIDEAIALESEDFTSTLRDHEEALLDFKRLKAWDEVDPAHAKLRGLASELLDGGAWRLLWLPPTIPYWPLDGPFRGSEGLTKSLLFSAWNVVPDTVSALLSYESERRMTGGRLDSYIDPSNQQRPLLRLTRTVDGKRSRARLFLLLLPALSLADEVHPLGASSPEEAEAHVRTRVRSLLAAHGARGEAHSNARPDDRWEWALPLVLDPGLREFLIEWRDDPDEDRWRPSPELFGPYVGDLLDFDLDTLGPPPADLEDLAVEIALGSPAVLAARTLAMAGIYGQVRRRLSVNIAESFWSLFNRPSVISLLQQLSEVDGQTGDEAVYWRLVLRYCRQGNLQAVLDEQWHMLWEQEAWQENVDAEAAAESISRTLAEVIAPRSSRVHGRFFRLPKRGHRVREEELRIRTDFCLRFGNLQTDDEGLSQDAVRAAFNSPFRPFVLATTSVGQEGLDFHPWCHRIVHWNLPGNPVDLEQREGRIHRYKSHAVRRNVAAGHSGSLRSNWHPGDDPWRLIFKEAESLSRSADEADLIPCWLASGTTRVERHVPLMPYTREVAAFARLKRQLAAYRVVFGQPRQEELLTLLDSSEVDTADLKSWAIDLSPRRR